MPDPRIHPIPTGVPTAVLVAAASGEVMAANNRRVDAEFINVSVPSEMISLPRGGTAVLGAGVTLTAHGSSYYIGTDDMFYGAINAISASGEAALAMDEGSNP